ncbi:MAG TPA: hypothetical protein VMC62_03235, partial [Longilinea sp.]|nr:hypothetical protein [Longilinea sp.]
HVNLALSEKPILQVNEVSLEAIQLAQPLEGLIAQYKLPPAKPGIKLRPVAPTMDPVFQKLRAMQVDPKWRERLTVVRAQYSLQKKTLECKPSGKELVVNFPLKQPGLNSFKITVHYETATEGPVHRIDYISVHVA